MDGDDSASDRAHSHHRSQREPSASKSNPDEPGRRARASGRSISSKRSRSKRSRERSADKGRNQTANSEPKMSVENIQESKIAHGVSPGKSDHSRHKRRKHRARYGNKEEFIETPVTRVLQEVPDDILDVPHSTLSRDQQFTYFGDGDTDHYRVQKGRDCVYVEHYGGFSSIPRHTTLTEQEDNLSGGWFGLSSASSLDIAVSIQKSWIQLADFSHGLLAGLALMQIIVVDRLFGSSSEELLQFISLYSTFSLIFSTTFFLLASICLVSVFDRFDLARGEWPYLVDILSVRPKLPWLLIPIYVGGLILALAAAKGDDFIHLSQFHNANMTKQKVELDTLSSWHVLNSMRCACVIVGWLIISMNHPPDLLLHLLTDILYQNSDTIQTTKA